MRRRHDAPIRANMENQNHNHYFHPEKETMPAEQIKALHSERLVKQVQHFYDHV